MARTPVPPEWRIALPDVERSADAPGRPLELTDAVANKIIMALRLGAHQGPAAAWAGMRPETMSRWMHRHGEPYETFQQKVREAEAWVEVRASGIVTGSKDAKDALAFLERRFPKRWRRESINSRTDVHVSMDLGVMLDRIEERRRNKLAPHDPRPLVIDTTAIDVTPEKPKREPVP